MPKEEDADVGRLAREVSDTLQRVISESPQISHSLNRIRSEGYEVSLVLEATVGLSRVGTLAEGGAPPSFDVRVENAEPAPLRMTPLDKKFLRSLKITVEQDEE
jgi:hypothetical protein